MAMQLPQVLADVVSTMKSIRAERCAAEETGRLSFVSRWNEEKKKKLQLS